MVATNNKKPRSILSAGAFRDQGTTSQWFRVFNSAFKTQLWQGMDPEWAADRTLGCSASYVWSSIPIRARFRSCAGSIWYKIFVCPPAAKICSLWCPVPRWRLASQGWRMGEYNKSSCAYNLIIKGLDWSFIMETGMFRVFQPLCREVDS